MRDDPTGPELDQLQRTLNGVLGQLETDLGMMLEGVEDHDPEGFLARLDERAQQLDEHIQDLRDVLGRMSDAVPTNFNLLAEKALADVLSVLDLPVVVRSTWGAGLPSLARHLSEPVSAALRRILSLSVRQAGPGGELKLLTATQDDLVLLHIDVWCQESDRKAAFQEPLHLRSRSVEQFVRDLGGSFHLADGPNRSLHVAAHFAAAVSKS